MAELCPWTKRWPSGAPQGGAAAGFVVEQSGGRRGHLKAMPRPGLGLGQSGGRWERRGAVPRRVLDRNVNHRKHIEASRW